MVTYIWLVVMMLSCGSLWAQEHIVAFYNVANLMDTHDDAATDDDDMLPSADKEWTEARYRHKLSSIARVVADMSQGCGLPALLGLAEVENRVVVEELAQEPLVRGAEYGVCHYESPDERGIDVALLYRPDLFRVERSVALRADVELKTRDHLFVWGELCGEPVLVVVVHFPSRIGGREFTSVRRERCAAQVRELVDSVRRSEPSRCVIVMGDMNDTPRDRSVRVSLGAKTRQRGICDDDLYNPFSRARRRGTIVYHDRWYLYDQIIVSADMLSSRGLRLSKCGNRYGTIFSQPYMLGGHRYPLDTYAGVEYVAGISDHLPVYVVVRCGK